MLTDIEFKQLTGLIERAKNIVTALKSAEVQQQMNDATETARDAFEHIKETADLTTKVVIKLLQAAGVLEKTETRDIDPRVEQILREVLD